MSDTIKNPQAFPQDVLHPVTGKVYGQEPGMTLRDYFAAKAMQAMITGISAKNELSIDVVADFVDDLAINSYTYADLMLKQREL